VLLMDRKAKKTSKNILSKNVWAGRKSERRIGLAEQKERGSEKSKKRGSTDTSSKKKTSRDEDRGSGRSESNEGRPGEEEEK